MERRHRFGLAALVLWAGLMFGIVATPSCTPDALQVQARAANAFALAANRGLPELVRAYRLEGERAIERAPDRAAAVAALAAVRTRWARVWGTDAQGQPCGDGDAAGSCRNGAWPALRAAEDAWAFALERQIAGEKLQLADVLRLAGDLRGAYCGLRGALPDGVAIPELPAMASCASSGGNAP